MIIKRIAVQNYRIHESLDLAFDTGINLLLGKNGAGKSSVLEALGLALFDADLRSTQADTVRRGAKTAAVTVEIQDADQRLYRIERKFGAVNSSRLQQIDEPSVRIEGKERVMQVVRKLAGIETNEKNLFQNVITASQNKIVSIFEGTNREREQIFNQIFDTAIYRQIFDGFARDALREYEQRMRIEQSRAEDIQRATGDIGMLRSRVHAARKDCRAHAGTVRELTARLENLHRDRETLDAKVRERDRLSAESRHTRELAEVKADERANSEALLAESVRAAAIVAENEAAYTTYRELFAKREALGAHIAAGEARELELRDMREQKAKAAEQQSALRARNDALAGRIVDVDQELRRLEAEAATRATSRAESADQLEALERDGRRLRWLRDELDERMRAYADAVAAVTACEEELKRLHESAPSGSRLESARADAIERRDVQRQALEKRDELSRRIHELQVRRGELDDARGALATGVCPFLDEECLNIGRGGDPRTWFDRREREIEGERRKLRDQLRAYDSAEASLRQANGDLAVIESRIADARAMDDRIAACAQRRALVQKDREIAELRLSAHLKEAGAANEGDLARAASTALEQWDASIAEMREQYGAARGRRDEIERGVKETERRLSLMRTSRSEADNERAGNARALQECEHETAALDERIEAAGRSIADLDQMRERSKSMDMRLAELRPGYEARMSHSQRASECDDHRRRLAELTGELARLEALGAKQDAKCRQASEAYSAEAHESVRASIVSMQVQRDDCRDALAQAQTARALAVKELEETIENQKRLRTLARTIAAFKRKRALAEQFRANVGAMGRFVASRLMTRIERIASRNFRSITGRGEQIRWISNERDSYLVYLAAGADLTGAQRFETLSGGEQVAVALSIRAAMASMMTRTHLAIFDEPTVNLDAERKIALAESLKTMLKDLRQAIIVTHDDAFREMAQKIIVLD